MVMGKRPPNSGRTPFTDDELRKMRLGQRNLTFEERVRFERFKAERAAARRKKKP